MSVKPIDSSSSFEESSGSEEIFIPRGQLNGRAYKHLDGLQWATRIFACLTVVAFLGTIAAIGLIQARMIPPLTPLYVFSGCLVSLVAMGIFHCCQQRIATNNGIDLEVYHKKKEEEGSLMDMILPDWFDCPKHKKDSLLEKLDKASKKEKKD